MVPKGTNYENELERRLWKEGWASFRVAGSGTVSHESADVVAQKDGKLIMFEVKSFWPRSMPLDLQGDSEQLRALLERACVARPGDRWYEVDDSTNAYFALYNKGESAWRYAPWDEPIVSDWESLGRLFEVLR